MQNCGSIILGLFAVLALQVSAESEPVQRRNLREQLRIFPPRIGRSEIHKRSVDLSSFPRVGRSNLQPFPRLGRTLSVFPRVGRTLSHFPRVGRTLSIFPRVGRTLSVFPRIGRSETDDVTWCTDCAPDMEMLRQLARRAVVMPPRIGRSGGRADSPSRFLVPRPRIGKRPEDSEDPSWFAEPTQQKSREEMPNKRDQDENGPLWFGPRLGRRRRDTHEDESNESQDIEVVPWSMEQ